MIIDVHCRAEAETKGLDGSRRLYDVMGKEDRGCVLEGKEEETTVPASP